MTSDVKPKRRFLFRRNEWWGLFAIFIGLSSIGIGLYWTIWLALRPLYYHSIVYLAHGTEWLLFLFFYGLGGLLLAWGRVELQDALPAHRARAGLAAEEVLRTSECSGPLKPRSPRRRGRD